MASLLRIGSRRADGKRFSNRSENDMSIATKQRHVLQARRSIIPIILITLCAIAFAATGYLLSPSWKEFLEIRDFAAVINANRNDLLAVERACEAMRKQEKRNVMIRGLERALRGTDEDVRAAGLAATASIGLDAEPLVPLIRRIAASETPEGELARGVLSHFREHRASSRTAPMCHGKGSSNAIA